MSVVAVLSLLFLLGALVLGRQHLRAVRAIPVRVHVNGTRGKSGVTRLIVAGLQEGGLSVLGKTTGTAARLLLPDGTERPFRRAWLSGPPSIGEQTRLVRLAARMNVDVLVSECMAVHPEIQRVAEDWFLRATHTVITNVRQDHSDVMGDTLSGVAETLALTVPHNGELLLGSAMANKVETLFFLNAAAQRRTLVINVADDLTPDEQSRFPSTFFLTNVATALTVCARLGVDRVTALRGMSTALPDPGELKVLRVAAHGRQFWLVDAFAANDAASTLHIWRTCRARPELCDLTAVGLCNSRADRGFRLDELARDFAAQAQHEGLADVLVLGEGLCTAKHLFTQAGLRVTVPAWLFRPNTLTLLRIAGKCSNGDVLLFGFGNTKGVGGEVSAWFTANGEAVA